MGKSNHRYMDTRRRELILALSGMSGAEDPGVVTPPVPDPGTPPAPPSDPPTPPETPDPSPPAEDRTYTKAEVDAIINESKGYRKRAQAAEGKLSEAEKAQMNELERAKKEAEENKTRADEAEKRIAVLTLQQNVVTEAVAQGFTNPSDVVAFLNLTDIKLDDDGKPDTNSLKAAIKRLATEKPYLLKTNAGNGDGGARGGHAVDKSAEYEKEYQSRGMVPIS